MLLNSQNETTIDAKVDLENYIYFCTASSHLVIGILYDDQAANNYIIVKRPLMVTQISVPVKTDPKQEEPEKQPAGFNSDDDDDFNDYGFNDDQEYREELEFETYAPNISGEFITFYRNLISCVMTPDLDIIKKYTEEAAHYFDKKDIKDLEPNTKPDVPKSNRWSA